MLSKLLRVEQILRKRWSKQSFSKGLNKSAKKPLPEGVEDEYSLLWQTLANVCLSLID